MMACLTIFRAFSKMSQLKFRSVVLALLLASNVVSGVATADDVVAKLGSIELKQSQMKAILDTLDADTRKQVLASPEALGQLIRREVILRAVLKEATDKQWDKRPEVQAQLDRMREQTLVTSYLNDLARPEAGFPSDDDVKKVYDANTETFTAPNQYHVAQIYFAGTQEAQGKKAADIAAKAKTGDFATLAKANSEHKESAAQGGDMGWLPEPQMLPELRDAIAKLSAGQVSAPVKSASGWHVIKLIETKPAGLRPLSEVKEIIVSNLRLAKARQNEQQYLESLVKSQKLSVNEIALGALGAPGK